MSLVLSKKHVSAKEKEDHISRWNSLVGGLSVLINNEMQENYPDNGVVEVVWTSVFNDLPEFEFRFNREGFETDDITSGLYFIYCKQKWPYAALNHIMDQLDGHPDNFNAEDFMHSEQYESAKQALLEDGTDG